MTIIVITVLGVLAKTIEQEKQTIGIRIIKEGINYYLRLYDHQQLRERERTSVSGHD